MSRELILGVAFLNFQVILLAMLWLVPGLMGEPLDDFNVARWQAPVTMALIGLATVVAVVSLQVERFFGRNFTSWIVGLCLAEFCGLVGFLLALTANERMLGSILLMTGVGITVLKLVGKFRSI